MVRFINSIEDHDVVRASVGKPYTPTRKSNAGEALRYLNASKGCTGPCHGLSANAMWSAYCTNCPMKGE